MPTLKITIKEDKKVVFSRKISKFPIVFGRGKQNHITFPDTSYLSRTHGSIGFLQDKIVVVDLNSTNGIFVDNAQIHSVTFSKKGVFSAGIYVFELEEIAGEPVEKNRTSSPSIETDTSELTNISKRLISIAKRLKFEVEDSLADLDPTDITLQAVVTWGKDIFDVRQFQSFDFVVAGASPFDPISIPSLRNKIKLGKYVNNRGELSIPFGLKWRLERGGISYDSEQAIVNKFVKSSQKSVRFGLSLDDVCTIDLGNETSLHLRYVEVPRPFIPKTWIENKEVFKKAILISLGVHLLFSLVSVFSAEKIIAPEVENIPPRFAKLILEPPKMILAPPPVLPKVEDVKPPEPLPVADTKPPTPDKEEPPPPKADLKPVAKPKPVPKDQPKPERTAKAEKMPTKVEPGKTSAQQMADSFSDMFSETETAAPIGAKNAPIKLDKNSNPEASAKGVSIAGVAGVLKSQVGKMQVNEGNSPSVGQQVGNVGYQTSGSGKTGKRKVVSGVLGTPKLEQPTIPQGISQDQVMLVVNKYLNDIHRCYERALMENSNLTGRVEYEWKISASGSVTSSKVKRSEMSNADSLNKCVLAIFEKMKFPAAKNGQSTLANIGFPFGKL